MDIYVILFFKFVLLVSTVAALLLYLYLQDSLDIYLWILQLLVYNAFSLLFSLYSDFYSDFTNNIFFLVKAWILISIPTILWWIYNFGLRETPLTQSREPILPNPGHMLDILLLFVFLWLIWFLTYNMFLCIYNTCSDLVTYINPYDTLYEILPNRWRLVFVSWGEVVLRNRLLFLLFAGFLVRGVLTKLGWWRK